MPAIELDTREVTRLRTSLQTLPLTARPIVWQALRATSFTVERWVKIAMPVLTGRARASWGHSSAPAAPEDGIWEEDEPHGTITQGSRVPYIDALNEGHSKQAPAGFLDAIELRGENELDRAIGEAIDKIMGTL